MSLSIIGHGAVASVYVGVDNIIGHGAVDNGYASIIGRLRYMYIHASLLFQARYQLCIGRIQSTEILVTSKAITSEESPDIIQQATMD